MAAIHQRAHFLLATLPFGRESRTSSPSCLHFNTIEIRGLEHREFCRRGAVEPKRNATALAAEATLAASNVLVTHDDLLLEIRVSDNGSEVDRQAVMGPMEQSIEGEFDSEFEMFLPPGAVLSDDKPLRRLAGSNIYIGPFAKNSKVKQAEFVKSSKGLEDCPDVKLPEFAIIGRSNVGKSSLINALVQRKGLAQTSKKPGKTQLINHFIINNSWYLVDLPGYGYAKVPTGIRHSWNDFTKDFFLRSKTLVCVMLLIDASIPAQKIDVEYATWLHKNKVPFTIVFMKCDRKKKAKNGGKKPEENVNGFLTLLKTYFDESPPWIMTSCVTNQGKDALLLHMSQLRNYSNS